MPGLMQMIFKPHDGSRQRVHDAVTSSRKEVQRAVHKFEETVREFLERNDELTGRGNATKDSSSE